MIYTLLLISFLYYDANNAHATEIQLSCGEPDKSAYVEGVDNLDCNCYWPGNNMTFEWTFTQTTGHRLTLARCTDLDSCTSFFPSDIEVTMYSTFSELYFSNLNSRYAGNITCTQTNSTFQGSASFTIKLTRVSIRPCQGSISLQEDMENSLISCEHSPFIPSTVTWTIATHSGQMLHLGNCTGSKNFKYNCISPLSPNITLTSDKISSSILFASNVINRDMATVICSASYSDHAEADNCTLEIYHPATVENCSLETIPQNWSLSLSCDVAQVFSTQGQYNFSVSESFSILKNGQLMPADNNLFEDSLSYRQYLALYINSTDKRKYYRGRVVYTWSMPPYPGTIKSFEFQTSHSSMGQLTFPNGFNINLPIRPTHNCSDVMTPCSCSTETLGSPAGRLLWLIGNTTAAVGDYDVKELVLPLDNMPSGKDVMVATCQLDWIQFLVARKPVVLRKPHISEAVQFRLLTIVSWTILGLLIVFDVIFMAILVRFGRFTIFHRERTSEQPEDKVGSHNYESLKTHL